MTIGNNYLGWLNNLSLQDKLVVIAHLSNSVLAETAKTEKPALSFFDCFGALETKESADEIIENIRGARTFRDKNIPL